MLTESQIRYIEDVLGTSPRYFTQNAAAPLAVPVASTTPVVFAPELNESEQSLLRKILASIKVTDYQMVATSAEALVRGLADNPSTTSLVFGLVAEMGAVKLEGQKVWSMPALNLMLETSANPVEFKKVTWGILKQLQQELTA